MATSLATGPFGVIYTYLNAFVFNLESLKISLCYKVHISHHVGFLHPSAYYLPGFLFITFLLKCMFMFGSISGYF